MSIEEIDQIKTICLVVCLVREWLGLRSHQDAKGEKQILRIHEFVIRDPPSNKINENQWNRIAGAMVGLALGDALGAHVRFRPREYLVINPVCDLGSGGTWGLQRGQVR